MSLRTSFLRNSLCALKIQRTKAGGNIEFVRYRKPRFEPKAASKIYRVREPTPMDPVETEMMKEWNRRYGSDMKSILRYLKKFRGNIASFQDDQNEEHSVHQQYDTIRLKNDAFSEISRLLREPALENLKKTELLKYEKLVLREAREKEDMRKEAEQKIKLEEAKFNEYVLPENLDENIERLLNTRSDHNYSITKQGAMVNKKEGKEASKEDEDDSTN